MGRPRHGAETTRRCRPSEQVEPAGRFQTLAPKAFPIRDLVSPHEPTSWVRARRATVLPSKRLLSRSMMAKFGSVSLVSETPSAQGAPANVMSLPRMILSRVLYSLPFSARRPWSIRTIPQLLAATVSVLPVTCTSWDAATTISDAQDQPLAPTPLERRTLLRITASKEISWKMPTSWLFSTRLPS